MVRATKDPRQWDTETMRRALRSREMLDLDVLAPDRFTEHPILDDYQSEEFKLWHEHLTPAQQAQFNKEVYGLDVPGLIDPTMHGA